jgi:hypothetical protein
VPGVPSPDCPSARASIHRAPAAGADGSGDAAAQVSLLGLGIVKPGSDADRLGGCGANQQLPPAPPPPVSILDRFRDITFAPERLSEYKEALTFHIEENLQVRLSGRLPV